MQWILANLSIMFVSLFVSISLIITLFASLVSGVVDDFPIIWTSYPKATPSQAFPDGGLLGNGHIQLTTGGYAGEPGKGSGSTVTSNTVTFYITTNGYWNVGNNTNSSYPPALEEDGLSFPGCPADNCTIPVGITIGMVQISSLALGNGSWTSQLWLTNATNQIVLEKLENQQQVTITVWISAVSDHIVFNITNTGTSPISDLNITTIANGNVLQLPITHGCLDSSTYTPVPNCPTTVSEGIRSTSTLPFVGQYVRKAASLPGSDFPMDGIIAFRPLLQSSSNSIIVLNYTSLAYTVPQNYWGNGKIVDTPTSGTTMFVNLPSSASIYFVGTAGATHDPGIYPTDLVTAISQRLNNFTDSLSSIQQLYTVHTNWWNTFWSASSITLDSSSSDTEGFWYTSLYAMGASSRAGQLVSDLWAGFRTTDMPLWRSNPTMDYNQQALYSWIFTSNHPELAQPYYDFLIQAMPGASLESANMGCPGGVHLSVDLVPFGLKLGVWGVPEDWGIISNGAYAAMTYVYHYESTPLNVSWIENYAWPYLNAVAIFWKCHLVKTTVPNAPDGYEYWDVNDCNGDEGCSLPANERTNPMWGITYIRRVFGTLIDMSAKTNIPIDPDYADIYNHLPPLPTTFYPKSKTETVPVLSWYGQSTFTNFGGQGNELHAIWPGELLSASEPNGTLIQAAWNALDAQQWGQSNTFSWVYSSAARVGYNLSTTIHKWESQLSSTLKTNRLISFGGLCSDSLGAAQFVTDMLVQGQEGFIRVFPAWPGERNAQFESLRVKGSVIVSSMYVGQAAWNGIPGGITGGTTEVTIISEIGGNVTLLSPWPKTSSQNVIVCSTNMVVDNDKAYKTKLSTLYTAIQTNSFACNNPVNPVFWSTIGGINGGTAVTWNAMAQGVYVVYTK